MQRLAVAACAALSLTLAVQIAQPPARAGYATNVGYLKIGNDYIVNFDFYSQEYRKNNVDWQMNFMHFGKASQNAVECRMGCGSGYQMDATAQFGNKQGLINNNGQSGWYWEGSDGKATSRPFCGTDRYHFRPYAPGDYAFYDSTGAGWGYWVMASSHRDINDGCNGRSGWSENAEDHQAAYLRSLKCGPAKTNCGYGAHIYKDYLWMGDSIGGYDRYQGSSHYWQTDGRATVYRWTR